MRKSTLRKWRAAKQQAQERAAENELMAAAVHEAGHAVVHDVFREGVEYAELHTKTSNAWIARTGGMCEVVSTGFTQPKVRDLNTRRDLELESMCCLAGPLAEECFTCKKAPDIDDMTMFGGCAKHFNLSKEEAVVLLEKTIERVNTWMSNDRVQAAIKEVATALAVHKRISGDEVRLIVDRHGREEMLRSAEYASESSEPAFNLPQ